MLNIIIRDIKIKPQWDRAVPHQNGWNKKNLTVASFGKAVEQPEFSSIAGAV